VSVIDRYWTTLSEAAHEHDKSSLTGSNKPAGLARMSTAVCGVKGATHFDLYDRDQCVTPAVTKIDAFFRQHLSPTTASAPRRQRLEPIRD
jgi:hypothetical protein